MILYIKMDLIGGILLGIFMLMLMCSLVCCCSSNNFRQNFPIMNILDSNSTSNIHNASVHPL